MIKKKHNKKIKLKMNETSNFVNHPLKDLLKSLYIFSLIHLLTYNHLQLKFHHNYQVILINCLQK